MPLLIDNYVPMYSTPFASMGNYALLGVMPGGPSTLDLSTLLFYQGASGDPVVEVYDAAGEYVSQD